MDVKKENLVFNYKPDKTLKASTGTAKKKGGGTAILIIVFAVIIIIFFLIVNKFKK
jgi:hypothetical protein